MTKTSFGVVGAVVLAAVSLVGCGSSGGGGGSCNAAQPCGGSVVGTWSIVSTCIDQSAINMSLAQGTCPSATATETLDETGTITFNADLSYSDNLSFNANLVENLPSSCLQGFTCAQLNDLSQPTTTTPGTTATVSCTGTTTCTCHIATSGTNVMATGTYATSGTTLTVTPAAAGSTPSTDGYCVQGNMLHLTAAAMAAMGMSTSNIGGEVVLQRQ